MGFPFLSKMPFKLETKGFRQLDGGRIIRIYIRANPPRPEGGKAMSNRRMNGLSRQASSGIVGTQNIPDIVNTFPFWNQDDPAERQIIILCDSPTYMPLLLTGIPCYIGFGFGERLVRGTGPISHRCVVRQSDVHR